MQKRSWRLGGAQKIADEFPYTFYKPSKEVVSQLKEGNQAKLIFEFESDDPEAPRAERMWAERMWVEITSIKDGGKPWPGQPQLRGVCPLTGS